MGYLDYSARRREQADRLTLIDRWRWFVLDRPLFVRPGETIWTKEGRLMVQRVDGRIDAHAGYVCR